MFYGIKKHVKDKQVCIDIWKGFKKRQNMWNKQTKQHKKSRLGFLDKYLCMHAHGLHVWDLLKTLMRKYETENRAQT